MSDWRTEYSCSISSQLEVKLNEKCLCDLEWSLSETVHRAYIWETGDLTIISSGWNLGGKQCLILVYMNPWWDWPILWSICHIWVCLWVLWTSCSATQHNTSLPSNLFAEQLVYINVLNDSVSLLSVPERLHTVSVSACTKTYNPNYVQPQPRPLASHHPALSKSWVILQHK